MADFKGKYLKVWEVKENNGYIKLDLGDSIKQKDGTYKNWTWFDCALFGEAGKKEFVKGDVVEVTSGQIYQEEYNGKWYTRVKIFHIQKMDVPNVMQNNSAPKQENIYGSAQQESKKPNYGSYGSYNPEPKADDFSGGAGIPDDKIPF